MELDLLGTAIPLSRGMESSALASVLRPLDLLSVERDSESSRAKNEARRVPNKPNHSPSRALLRREPSSFRQLGFCILAFTEAEAKCTARASKPCRSMRIKPCRR